MSRARTGWISINEYAVATKMDLSKAWLQFMNWEFQKKVVGEEIKGVYKYPKLLFKPSPAMPLATNLSDVVAVLYPLGASKAVKWLTTPNAALEGKKPTMMLAKDKARVLELATQFVTKSANAKTSRKPRATASAY